MALLTGCAGMGHLGVPPPDQRPQIQWQPAKRIDVPCRIAVLCAQNLIGRRQGLCGSRNYSYPLKQVVQLTFDDAAYRLFQRPRGDVLSAFDIEVEVYEARLTMGGGARCFIQMRATIASPEGKRIVSQTLEKHARSRFDGRHVPPCVLQALADMAVEYMQDVATDPKVRIAAQKYTGK